MLVLTRKQNETILIDGCIKIEVLKCKGNTIKLGISAPNDVKILRGELAPFGKENELPVTPTDSASTPASTPAATPTSATTSAFVNTCSSRNERPNPNNHANVLSENYSVTYCPIPITHG